VSLFEKVFSIQCDDFKGKNVEGMEKDEKSFGTCMCNVASYRTVDFHDFQPLYEYIAKMYFKKYITDDMTREEAESVFDAFYEEITFNFENMNRKYTIDENTFLPTFEAYLGTLGIE